MATVTDVEVANASFPNVRQDLNDILEALATNFSADAEPTTMYPNQFWYETDTNLLKFRNEDNDAWITLAYFDQTADEWEVRTAVVQAVDAGGLALKTDDGTTRFSISDAGVVSFENYAFPSADGTAGQVLSTDGSGTLTFEDAGAGDKIEEGNSSVEVVDTGTGYVAVTVDGSETARFDANGRLGIGTSSPSNLLTVNKGTGSTPTVYINNSSTNVTEGVALKVQASGRGAGTADVSVFSVYNDVNEIFTVRNDGNVGIGTTSPAASLNAITSDIQGVGRFEATNGSYTSTILFLSADRAASSSFHYVIADSDNGADNEYRIRGDGNVFADGTFSGGGADYAEYFEWADGNTSNEDRRGYTVVLDGNKVRKATDEDDASQIIGVISAHPAVVGDSAWNKWSGKHLKDEFGSYIWEEHNVIEWTETDDEGNEQLKSYEDWVIPDDVVVPDDAVTKTHDEDGNRFKHRKVNPDYDPNVEYVAREDRQEWDTVGLMGKLRIRKGQPVGDRWIKMRDISDSVEEWLVR